MLSIVKSHFHKGKTGFLITGLFIVLAAVMMIVGLSICFGMDTLYYNAKNLSNSPDCSISVYEKTGGDTQKILEEIINKRDDVQSYDFQPIFYLSKAKDESKEKSITIYNSNGNVQFDPWVAMNIDDEENYFKPHLRDTVDKDGYKFYFTGNFIETNPVKIGDEVRLYYGGNEYVGYVAGIYDDMTKIYAHGNVYVSGDLYKLISEWARSDKSIVEEYNLNIRLGIKNEKENELAQQKLVDELEAALIKYNTGNLMLDPSFEGVYYSLYTREMFRSGTRAFIMLLGTAMTAFSVLVALIVAIVTAFLVRSSIMDEVRNLGVWKSLGYTTSQLRSSYLAIYGFIGGICLVIGTVLGISLMPTFVGIITDLARLDCSHAIGTHIGGVVLSILFIVLTIAAVVYLSTARVKSITPLSAMRNNIATHSFKRNKAPLDNSKISLNAHLGIKSIVGEPHRSVMVLSIILIMSLLCSFVSVIFYNLKVDQTAIINMSGVENADYYLDFYYDDPSPYYDALSEMEGFEAIVKTNGAGTKLEGEFSYGKLFSSFDHLRTKFLYKGRYPVYSDEILIDEHYAIRRGFNIGDTVAIHIEKGNKNVDRNCVIVGYFQNIFDNCSFIGFDKIIDGLFDEQEKEKIFQHLVYFEKDKVPSADEIDAVLTNVAGGPVKYNGFFTGRKALEMSILDTVETAADATLTVFFIITAVVISFLLIMIIKLKLLREKRHYAIYKALGYTTVDIMTQIAISMVILGAIGSLVGALVGAFTTSPILSLFGGYIGAGHFDFVIPRGFTVAIIFGICALVYLVSMLCAISVRRIRPAMER